MARGRKPAPDAVKAAKGNTRRQRGTGNAASAVAVLRDASTVMPGYMTLRKTKMDEKGRLVRDRANQIIAFMKPQLEAINFLRPTDVNGFFRFCRYMADWLVCIEILDREGEFYLAKSDHNPDGIWRRHPVAHSIRVAEQNMRLLEAEYGLTPARRQQLMMQMASAGINVPASAGSSSGQGDDSGLFQGSASPIGMGSRLMRAMH